MWVYNYGSGTSLLGISDASAAYSAFGTHSYGHAQATIPVGDEAVGSRGHGYTDTIYRQYFSYGGSAQNPSAPQFNFSASASCTSTQNTGNPLGNWVYNLQGNAYISGNITIVLASSSGPVTNSASGVLSSGIYPGYPHIAAYDFRVASYAIASATAYNSQANMTVTMDAIANLTVDSVVP